MKKQEILRRVCKIVNKGKKRQDRIDKVQAECVIEAFKQTMVESIQKGQDFTYRGFIEVETTIVEPRERVNPKTQEPLSLGKSYKANIRLAYSIRHFIKSIVVK